jgi:F-type H+-transporting ATPase subunit delta
LRTETIARNYAEALFQLGERSDNVELYADLLDAVAAAVEQTPRVEAILMSPRIPKAEKAQLLGGALRDTPREFVLFLQALVRRGRQQILRPVATESAGPEAGPGTGGRDAGPDSR